MKFSLLAVFLVAFSKFSLAQPLNDDLEKKAVHGMVIFGQNTVYMSHLPMYHAPHDVQAIFAVKLSHPEKNVNDYYKPHTKPFGMKLYTFVPKPFKLKAMLKKPTFITGTLYEGHFERGGIPLLSDVKAEISHVNNIIYNRTLKSDDPTHSSYLMVGSHRELEAYLIHQIGGAPNFDHIAKVKLDSPTDTWRNKCKLDGHLIQFGEDKPVEIGFKGEYSYQKAMGISRAGLPLYVTYTCNYQVIENIYLDDQDLQH